ncbi:MAG: TVP38/TMEM64 family protein [Candidatus Woesearchaeota archaeon]
MKSNSINTNKIKSINKDNIKKLLIIILLFLILSFLFGWLFNELFSTREKILNFINIFKNFGPVIIILLIVLEVLIAPLPGFVITLSSGYIYGFYLGTIYTWVGNVLGASLAFWLARMYGRPFIERNINFSKVKKYDVFFEHKKKYLWLLYVIPFFPIDIISFASGFSNLEYKYFLFTISISLIPNVFIFNYFGQQIYSKNAEAILFVGLITIVITILLFFLLDNIMKK